MTHNVGLLLLVIGVMCLVVAVVGGGLKLTAREFNIRPIDSFPRQIILGLVGIVVASYGVMLFSGQGAGVVDIPGAKPISTRPAQNSADPVPIKLIGSMVKFRGAQLLGVQGMCQAERTFG